MKKIYLTLTVIVFAVFSLAQPVKADFYSFLKGCVIIGGTGVGGAMVASSVSRVDYRDSQALLVAGVTSCIVGGFLSQDINRRAEMRAEQELRERNVKLRHQVYSVMHDLCVMKEECGPDGLPYKKKNLQNKSGSQSSASGKEKPQTMESGN